MSQNAFKTTQAKLPAAIFDLIYLAGCAVNNYTPPRKYLEQMNLPTIYRISVLHSLVSISWMALEDAYDGKLPDTELFREWKEEKDHAIYRNVLFDSERMELFAFLEKSGIWYAPLKGILMKDLYPRFGMRQMADNDILFDASQEEKVHEWFLSRNYTAESYRQGHHNAYCKEPMYNFEMHTSLFDSHTDLGMKDYWIHAASRMIPMKGTRYGRLFTDDDFYIYLITHTYKHYSGSGTGLRSLLDCYVYNNAKGNHLNRTYIHDCLADSGIAEFEEEIRTLSQKLFGDPKHFSSDMLTTAESEMLKTISFSGTYGTVENQVKNDISLMVSEGEAVTGRTKLKYLWHRIVPGPQIFQNDLAFFYQHKWLRPVGYVYRLVKRAFKYPRRIQRELKVLLKL